MRILSHRGFWRTPEEKNTPAAFARSFADGFGTKADLHDHGGTLVIAHDPLSTGALGLRDFLGLHARHDPRLPLALKVNADGLVPLLVPLLAELRPADFFCFDMSGPETRHYLAAGLPVFTRQSDPATIPPFPSEVAGVWADAGADETWLTPAVILRHLAARRRVCVVSSELHGRNPGALWEKIHGAGLMAAEDLLLCTNRPDAARDFFG